VDDANNDSDDEMCSVILGVLAYAADYCELDDDAGTSLPATGRSTIIVQTSYLRRPSTYVVHLM